jgi:hypothetical protein
MKELSIDSVMGSLVNYGGDPMLIETEEQAEELLESINVLRPITDEDELETAKIQLDLEGHDEVTKVYGFVCDGCAAVVCFAEDWEY